jgi:hypothetical protein
MPFSIPKFKFCEISHICSTLTELSLGLKIDVWLRRKFNFSAPYLMSVVSSPLDISNTAVFRFLVSGHFPEISEILPVYSIDLLHDEK